VSEPRQTAAGAPAPQQAFAALRHRGARIYLIGSAAAMMADSIEHVISYWIIYERFQSPALGGFAVVSHWLPFLFFSVWTGALADRFDPRRIIQLGMVMFMLASLSWGVLLLTDTLREWHAMVILTMHGFAGVLWGPAGQVLVHDIVGPAQLQSAIRLISMFRTLGLLMGPAVGGAIMLVLGPAWGILFNVLIYVPLTLWLWKAPYGPHFSSEKRAQRQAIRGFADIFETICRILGNRIVVTMIALAGGASLLVGNAYQAQMPEFAHDFGHDHADLSYSILLGATAAGALVAGILLESRGVVLARPQIAVGLAMLWCCAIGGFAMTEVYALAVALLFVAGFLDLTYNSTAQTLVQLNAPPEIRGRVVGLYHMFGLGLRAFSGVTVGIGGALVGIHWSLFGSAMILLAVTTTLMSLMIRTRPARASPGG